MQRVQKPSRRLGREAYERVAERDGSFCRWCLTSGETQIHHIKYRSHGGPDEDWNLISLCRKCHGFAHGVEPGLPFGFTRIPPKVLHDSVARDASIGLVAGTCYLCEFNKGDGTCMAIEFQPVSDDFGCDAWRPMK